jgi:putative PIN family toxin of toxin-antitoxin system
VRVLLDVNVLVSALLSRTGAPARLLEAAADARFELVVCGRLLEELERALAYPKIRARIAAEDAERFVDLVKELSTSVPDPEVPPPLRTADPGDDYLLAVAAREQVPLVSGDDHLLELAERAPIFSPRDFLERLG